MWKFGDRTTSFAPAVPANRSAVTLAKGVLIRYAVLVNGPLGSSGAVR